MTTASTIEVRPKHQMTLPMNIVKKAHIQVHDRISVRYLNGSIILTPEKKESHKKPLSSYAGIAQGFYGDNYISQERSTWER